MIGRNNTRKIVLLGVLVIFMLTLMNYTRFGRIGVSPMETALKDLFAPVQGLVMNLGHRLRGLVSFPFALVNMADENQLMRKRITELEGRLRQYGELQSENERLKKLLDFKTVVAPVMGYDLAAASVIGREPGNWFGIITINKGAGDGLKPNMVVVNDQGLIGRITSVSSHTAEVLLITDPRSGVAALIQENRAPGMVEGVASSPGRVRMVHVPIGTQVNKGQVVVTSGFGSLYPKGIPVGQVMEADREPSGLFMSAMILPFVDFNRLEEVMVITGTRSPQGEAKTAQLPYPWGEGKTDLRGRSPGAIRANERYGVAGR
ncbi:MAG: rod shape-determining protein MreC [Peptococcaceae bacterium]|nr:rod shape-determining protein MreC [Peptococcaceae bacterium]